MHALAAGAAALKAPDTSRSNQRWNPNKNKYSRSQLHKELVFYLLIY